MKTPGKMSVQCRNQKHPFKKKVSVKKGNINIVSTVHCTGRTGLRFCHHKNKIEVDWKVIRLSKLTVRVYRIDFCDEQQKIRIEKIEERL